MPAGLSAGLILMGLLLDCSSFNLFTKTICHISSRVYVVIIAGLYITGYCRCNGVSAYLSIYLSNYA